MACGSSVQPLLLPYTNVSVGSSFARGFPVSLGTPGQDIAFQISPWYNDTWVTNGGDCGNSNANATCAALKGGIYASVNSSSYTFTQQSKWNGTNTTSGSYTYFNDDVHLSSDNALYGLPMVEYTPGSAGVNLVGLGANSTFMNAAANGGSSPSRVWGLYTGSESITNPSDGGLVLGGYDAARYGSNFGNFTTTTACTTCAYVTGLQYLNGNSTQSIFPSNIQNFYVYLNPVADNMEISPAIFANWVNISGAQWYPEQGHYGWPAGTNLGNVRATFDNGYTVTLSAEDLFMPPRAYGANGQYTVTNDSVLITGLQNFSSSSRAPFWGQPFFASNYLIFDTMESRYTLANANRGNIPSSVRPICDAVTSVPPSSSPTNSGVGTPGSGVPSASPSPTGGSGGGSHVGAIAGGVVGGVVGLALVAAIAFFLLRKKRKAKANSASNTPFLEKPNEHHPSRASELPPYPAPSASPYTPGQVDPNKQTYAQTQNVNQGWNHHGDETMSGSMNRPFQAPVEMPAEYRVEMPTQQPRQELGGH